MPTSYFTLPYLLNQSLIQNVLEGGEIWSKFQLLASSLLAVGVFLIFVGHYLNQLMVLRVLSVCNTAMVSPDSIMILASPVSVKVAPVLILSKKKYK